MVPFSLQESLGRDEGATYRWDTILEESDKHHGQSELPLPSNMRRFMEL
jgi:hypothetical protein